MHEKYAIPRKGGNDLNSVITEDCIPPKSVELDSTLLEILNYLE